MDAPPEFSNAQWRFFAVLHAFREPVAIDIAGALAPLTPGPLFKLLRQGEALGWIIKREEDHFQPAPELPAFVRSRLNAINTPDRLGRYVSRLKKLNLIDRVGPETLSLLLAAAGRITESLGLDLNLAINALKADQPDKAITHLEIARGKTAALSKEDPPAEWFTGAALELSDLCFQKGHGLKYAVTFLEIARDVALRLGDQRQWALVQLHLGRIYYFQDRRAEALEVFTAGAERVEELGDADIMERSFEFLGLYYYMRGLFREALQYFERAAAALETLEQDHTHLSPLAPTMQGYCEAYLGQFHRAIGSLDCHWHMAKRRGNHVLAATIRAVLGTILLLIRKKREAWTHLNAALDEAAAKRNQLAHFLALGGLSYYHFLEGDLTKAADLLTQNMTPLQQIGSTRQYSSPWVLEMLFELEQRGFDVAPGWSFADQFERVMNEPNIHLRGVALRLRAREALSRGRRDDDVLAALLESEALLKQSGDPVQLAKTRLEIAQMKLARGETDESRYLAQKARQGLSGFWEELFPDGLRFLLEGDAQPDQAHDSPQEAFKRYLEINEELIPKTGLEDVLVRLVSAMNRFFMAERGGLFWFKNENDPRPRLRAARNLTPADVSGDGFQGNLSLILKSFREKRPLLSHPDGVAGPKRVLAMLCLPIHMNGRVRGVLYFDNSYLDNCFEFAQGPLLEHLTGHLTSYVERVWEYGQLIDTARRTVLEGFTPIDVTENQDILYRARTMSHILAQADRAAKSGASVLILGETGVGKELLARWIHQKSHRRQGPFIVIDPTTIPENLMESELFGHEKGAFTGADRRKQGRVELAHGGTLFIDEIGEIPLHLQTKFLRVLQEKTFVRIGGAKNVASDFRLLAATNRNLKEEVRSGRFREDFFYRINVLDLTIPPLRDRPEDIPFLARHFLALYARKHKRPGLGLSSEDEALLARYHWPGNVRELKNVMERSVLLSLGDRPELNLPAAPDAMPDHPFADTPTLDEVQRRYISHILGLTGGRISGPGGASELLGVKRTTLNARLKKLGLM